MKREEIVEKVAEYFVSSDHWRRLLASLQDPDPQGTHIHVYVDTCVHPNSLETIIKSYMEFRGWPLTRKIDYMSPRPGMGSLHGVEPKGKPHFDFQWFFKENVPLAPATEGEGGCNLLVWNRWYIEEFYRMFKFRKVGAVEKKRLQEYFKSEHFEKGLEIVVDPRTTHMHINVETSVHPDQIAEFALKALKEKKWKVDYVCPNVYLVKGQYRGKLVFMCREPEKVFDIGWHYNPNIIIEPTRDIWIFSENPGYDVWTTEMLDEVMKYPYVKLDSDEIKRILDVIKASLSNRLG